jgi:hypothetical protein
MTYEELLALGYDEETAKALVATSGQKDSSGVPFPVLKINYDLKDILVDAGVPKGAFISGWKTDDKNLKVEEEGEVIKQPMEFFIVSSVYQQSHYDKTTRKMDICTPIYTDVFKSKEIRDIYSGKTIGELKEEGKEVKFNNILLMMIKKGKEWAPYVHYLHGVNYVQFGEQCDEIGVPPSERVFKTLYKVKSKKVPTNFNPAWVFDIIEVKERSQKDIISTVGPVSEAVKTFNEWIK